MAYLDPKGKGKSSMPGNRRSSGQASEVGRCGTRVIWRKLDCLNPNLQKMQSTHPPERRLKPAPRSAPVYRQWSAQPSGRGAMPSEGIQGDEWDAYVTLVRTTGTNVGSPTGREPYGDGGLVVVVGVTTHQGGRESRPQGEGGQVIGHRQDREVCEMQSAETVLGVLRERGRRGLPLDELYRQLFNPQLYLLAYGRIYSNKGAMTPGADAETVDGMSLGKIGRIIDALRHERYRFSPVRRVYIPKKNGKTRPLGLPTWSDKLVGEVVRLLLGGVLRAAVLRPLPRVPSRPGLPHRAARGGQHLDRDDLVHRGRHRRLLRVARPPGHARRRWRRRSTTTGSCG